MNPTRYVSRTIEEPGSVPRVEPVVWGSEHAGPLDDATLANHSERGFHTIPQLLGDADLLDIETEISKLTERMGSTGDERVILERGSSEVRSVFQVHALSTRIASLASDKRILGRVRQILGGDVYLHQSRLNCKPGLRGREFYWHSDFETWHHEDGMPQMRAVSVSISLTENTAHNGSLMIVPGSHRTFIGCAGQTPTRHYEKSLRQQNYGVPSDERITSLVAAHGIETITGPAGSAVFFDSNCMHGSNGNITPFPRRNLFFVYNSVENRLDAPLGATEPRPDYIASRDAVSRLEASGR